MFHIFDVTWRWADILVINKWITAIQTSSFEISDTFDELDPQFKRQVTVNLWKRFLTRVTTLERSEISDLSKMLRPITRIENDFAKINPFAV